MSCMIPPHCQRCSLFVVPASSGLPPQCSTFSSNHLLQDQGKETMSASDDTIPVVTCLATVGTTRPILQPVHQSKFLTCPCHRVPQVPHSYSCSVLRLGMESAGVCDSSMQSKRESHPHLQSSKSTREQIAGGLLVTLSEYTVHIGTTCLIVKLFQMVRRSVGQSLTLSVVLLFQNWYLYDNIVHNNTIFPKCLKAKIQW